MLLVPYPQNSHLSLRIVCYAGEFPSQKKFLSKTEDRFRGYGNARRAANSDPLFFDLQRYRKNQEEHIRVKRLMDTALLKRRWDVVESICWEVPTGKPIVAAAGAQSLEDLFQKNRNNDKTCIFVTAFPEQEGKTLVVVSSMKEDSEIVRCYLRRIGILGKDGRDPEVSSVLSKVLLRYCRYVCISPSFFEAKSRDEWKKILTYWYEAKNDPFYDLKYESGKTLNLFCELGS